LAVNRFAEIAQKVEVFVFPKNLDALALPSMRMTWLVAVVPVSGTTSLPALIAVTCARIATVQNASEIIAINAVKIVVSFILQV
jgi:hypothetical protein